MILATILVMSIMAFITFLMCINCYIESRKNAREAYERDNSWRRHCVSVEAQNPHRSYHFDVPQESQPDGVDLEDSLSDFLDVDDVPDVDDGLDVPDEEQEDPHTGEDPPPYSKDYPGPPEYDYTYTC